MAELVIPLECTRVMVKDVVWAVLSQVCKTGKHKVSVRSDTGNGKVDVVLSRAWVDELCDRKGVLELKDLVGEWVLPVHDCVKVGGRYWQRCLVTKSNKPRNGGEFRLVRIDDVLADKLTVRLRECLDEVLGRYQVLVRCKDTVLETGNVDCGLGSISVGNEVVVYIKDTVVSRLVKVLLFRLLKRCGREGIAYDEYSVKSADGSDELLIWVGRSLRDMDRLVVSRISKAGLKDSVQAYSGYFMGLVKSQVYYRR